MKCLSLCIHAYQEQTIPKSLKNWRLPVYHSLPLFVLSSDLKKRTKKKNDTSEFGVGSWHPITFFIIILRLNNRFGKDYSQHFWDHEVVLLMSRCRPDVTRDFPIAVSTSNFLNLLFRGVYSYVGTCNWIILYSRTIYVQQAATPGIGSINFRVCSLLAANKTHRLTDASLFSAFHPCCSPAVSSNHYNSEMNQSKCPRSSERFSSTLPNGNFWSDAHQWSPCGCPPCRTAWRTLKTRRPAGRWSRGRAPSSCTAASCCSSSWDAPRLLARSTTPSRPPPATRRPPTTTTTRLEDSCEPFLLMIWVLFFFYKLLKSDVYAIFLVVVETGSNPPKAVRALRYLIQMKNSKKKIALMPGGCAANQSFCSVFLNETKKKSNKIRKKKRKNQKEKEIQL